MSSPELRTRVLGLYKTLLYMGRDYPQGYNYFRARCYNAFKKNKDIQEPAEIEKLLKRGEFVVGELNALYFLKKYRTLKRRYYSDESEQEKFLRLSAKLEEKYIDSIDPNFKK